LLSRLLVPLDPGRRSRRTGVGFQRRLRQRLTRVAAGLHRLGLAGVAARLNRLIGAAKTSEWIGLTDKPRKFGEWIVLAPRGCLTTAAVIVAIGGERSVLVSISHRDVASPSGKPPTPSF
jgi:hypothetical protein